MAPHAPEAIARAFHATYEDLAPDFGYRTRRASAVPWDDVPAPNRLLMISVVEELLADGVIEAGPDSAVARWMDASAAPRS